MARIASFHLVREHRWRAALAMMRLATDRPTLQSTDGLRFWRLLGTGDGSNTGPGADLRRTALFAVWEDESALDRFLAESRIAERWERAEESWHVRLRTLGGHGQWHGVDPLDGLAPGSSDGPIAFITRANVRPRAWRDFRRAGREVDAELRTAAGLIDVVGVGEAPVGRLATFSLWESMTDVRRFAYSMPRHRHVVEETRNGAWYGEEMFAPFEPYGPSGRWDGRNPLSDDPERSA